MAMEISANPSLAELLIGFGIITRQIEQIFHVVLDSFQNSPYLSAKIWSRNVFAFLHARAFLLRHPCVDSSTWRCTEWPNRINPPDTALFSSYPWQRQEGQWWARRASFNILLTNKTEDIMLSQHFTVSCQTSACFIEVVWNLGCFITHYCMSVGQFPQHLTTDFVEYCVEFLVVVAPRCQGRKGGEWWAIPCGMEKKIPAPSPLAPRSVRGK